MAGQAVGLPGHPRSGGAVKALDNPLGRALMESADAMIDAVYDNEDVAEAWVKMVSKGESEDAKRDAKVVLSILMAMGQGKIPHVKWEPRS
jgi:hypothetical protein